MRLALATAVSLAAVVLLAFGLRRSDSDSAPDAEPKRCTADALAPAIGEGQGVNSVTLMVTLLVRNRTTSACTLRGSVALELGPDARGPVVIQPVSGGIFGPWRRRVLLPARGKAWAGVLIHDDCSNPRLPGHRIELRVRTGSRRSVPLPIDTCASGTTLQVGTWQPY